MIHYLKIKNFGPVKNEAEINFEVADSIQEDAYEIRMGDGRKLLKLAYIYGANASGKTTILKAFDFLRKILLSPAGDKAQELSFDPFLFCEDAYSKPSYFELSFYVDEIRYLYTLNFTKHSILNEKLVFYQTARPTELFSRQTDPEKRLTKIQFGTKVRVPAREKDLLESNTLHNNTVLGAYAKTNVDIPELEMLNKWFSTYLLGLVTSSHDLTELTAELIDRNPKINEWIDTLLYKADNQIAKVIVPDWNEQVGIPSDQPIQILRPESLSDKTIKRSPVGSLANVDRFFGGPSERKIEFFHKIGKDDIYPLSIQKESSGTKRYFGLGGPLYELIHGSHLLCIDELETSLHPDLMKHFLQVFLVNSTRSQLLITTHNLSLMADTDFIRRDALWFSEKEDDGSVSLFSAADFDTTILRKDASLINAYRVGRLGAKPNLGSPYITLVD
ncbi:ATP/GTP-binding protein [Sphingobacterium sp. JB170]|uniref:AAA family ATPase n=1 Tax=Sphingobacterium sp. JB170 TaxID=1434842 RepID=UPI00097EEFD8|nr:ATP-binding protein [Sphingobacterium sp. JB170]SJN41084.1 RloA [Sphingobacterium sp. JB170]